MKNFIVSNDKAFWKLDSEEMFKFIIEEFSSKELNQNLDICDAGCANGEFLYYLDTKSNFNLHGIDILHQLIKKAKEFVPNVKYKQGDIQDKKMYNKNQFDVVFLTGVHSIFDEYENLFDNLIEWTKDNGKVIITGLFNPFPIDVFIKYKKSGSKSSYFESGWNMFSIDSISNFLSKNKKVKSFSFDKFKINIDLDKKPDIVRSWTTKDSNDNRFITNGLSIIQNHYRLVINIQKIETDN